MRFTPLSIDGAFIVAPTPHTDARGLFTRTWCRSAFAEQGLTARLVQCSTSFNARRGTLRGIHFQRAPHQEAKLVRCTRGAAFDVVVDLREGSPTFGHWQGVEIDADNRLAVYVPEGVAHGFQTLADRTEIFYQMSTPFSAGHAAGLRWDDPQIGVAWPLPEEVILSDRDRALPGLDDTAAVAMRGRA